MGTSNFYNKNARSIFALHIEDHWEYDAIFNRLSQAICDELGGHGYTSDNAPAEPNRSRSFTGRVLAEAKKHTYDPERPLELIVHIKAIIRSGYYSGANLDWDLEVEKIHREPLTAEDELWIQNAKEDLINNLEAVYKQFSEELYVAGRFSNGNCVYHKK